jgi:hypothetical protein
MGTKINKSYYDVEYIRDLQPSAWTMYPEMIKFHSIDIKWHKESNVLTRNTYTMLDMLGDTGGIWFILETFCKVLVPIFSANQLSELLAKRGYDQPSQVDIKSGFCSRLQRFFCCCAKKMVIQKKHLLAVRRDIKRDLDVLTLLRRLRVHG